MTYGYLRVSTDKQDENNQKLGVEEKARRMMLEIDEYIIDAGVSGTKEPEKRELGKLLGKLKNGDMVIASEISRLGRSMYMVMRILEHCMKTGVRVVTVKDNYELGDNIQSKVLAFAFSLAAEIERDMISRRTKEALARRRQQGIIFGRPHGRKSAKTKLSGKEKEIKKYLKEGLWFTAIGRILGVSRVTVQHFAEVNGLVQKQKVSKTKPQSQSKIPGLISNKELLKRINSGETIIKIAKSIGVNHYTLAKYVQLDFPLWERYQEVQDKIRIEKNGGLRINKQYRRDL
jgi:DNA invertase Pin-like site-specific DNA recombinase